MKFLPRTAGARIPAAQFLGQLNRPALDEAPASLDPRLAGEPLATLAHHLESPTVRSVFSISSLVLSFGIFPPPRTVPGWRFNFALAPFHRRLGFGLGDNLVGVAVQDLARSVGCQLADIDAAVAQQ